MSTLAQEVRNVHISKLKDCPVSVTIHTRRQIEEITRVAKTNPELIAPLTVCILDNKEYLADGKARVEGLTNADIDEFPAKIMHVKSMQEIIILHHNLNKHGTINPMGVRKASQFMMAKLQVPYSEVVKKLNLDKSMEKVLGTNLGGRTETVLNEWIEKLCEKHNNVTIPAYLITYVGKFQGDQQTKAFETIAGALDMQRDDRFAIPSPEGLNLIIDGTGLTPSKEKTPIIISQSDVHTGMEKSENDRTGKTNDTMGKLSIVPSKDEQDRAKYVLDNTPRQAYLNTSCTKCGHKDEYAVDLKRKTFSRIDETKNEITLKGDQGSPVFQLPQKFAEFLELRSGEPVHIYGFATMKQLETFTEKTDNIDEKFKIVIISTVKIGGVGGSIK